jgi:hypothetical protein
MVELELVDRQTDRHTWSNTTHKKATDDRKMCSICLVEYSTIKIIAISLNIMNCIALHENS